MSTSKQRLVMTLAGAGVPVDRVTITGPGAADVTYMDGATQAQRDQGAEVLAGYDWTDEAEHAWETAKQTAAAKAILTAEEPMPKATRAACFALMLSLQEARAKLNELVAAVNTAHGTTIEPLVTGSTFAEALTDVAAVLDAGIA